MKQQSLFKHDKLEFGGDLLTHKRKGKRPLPRKALMHVVLRADISQSGSLLKHRGYINEQFNKWSTKYIITIEDFALCSNHIHVALIHQSDESYKNFIRVITGALAQHLKIKWIKRPYTRPTAKGLPTKILKSYILQNHQEALGLIPYAPRKLVRRNTIRSSAIRGESRSDKSSK